MVTYKPIAHIWEDYNVEADNHQRLQQHRIDTDPRIRELDALIGNIGMQFLYASQAGRNTEHLKRKLDELDAERTARVASIGVQKYKCSACHDKGIVGGRYCRCIRSRIYREHYHAYDPLKSPVSLDTYSLDCFSTESEREDFSPLEMAKLAFKAAKAIVDELPDRHQGLLINGEPGLGKTWLAGATARSAVERGIDTAYIHATHLFSMYHLERLGHNVDMSYLETAQFLIVDDLGAEPMTANVTVESLLRLLTLRSEAHLPTILVTNESKIQIRYGERISSRVFGEDFIDIRMIGHDLRDKDGRAIEQEA